MRDEPNRLLLAVASLVVATSLTACGHATSPQEEKVDNLTIFLTPSSFMNTGEAAALGIAMAAAASIAILPIAVLTTLVQRNLVRGLSSGAIKDQRRGERP